MALLINLKLKNKTMTKIIAEIGWNHMGDMSLAKEMIVAAAENGADFAKFQTWSVKRLKSGDWDVDGRREIYEKAELTLDQHLELKEYCNDNDIEFISSVFSLDDLELYKKVTNKTIKIPSFESRNKKLIKGLFSKSGKAYFNNIIVSVGTCSYYEIKNLIRSFQGLLIDNNLETTNANLNILHCVSCYPCDPLKSNLERINLLSNLNSNEIPFKVGYSDHCIGTEIAKMSLGYNINILEKHFTIDHSLPGRDNKFAILPEELKQIKDTINLQVEIKKNINFHYDDSEIESRTKYPSRFSNVNKQTVRQGL